MASSLRKPERANRWERSVVGLQNAGMLSLERLAVVAHQEHHAALGKACRQQAQPCPEGKHLVGRELDLVACAGCVRAIEGIDGAVELLWSRDMLSVKIEQTLDADAGLGSLCGGI